MDIKKPKLEKISFKNVEWGSKEFNELVKKAQKQQEELRLYKKTLRQSTL